MTQIDLFAPVLHTLHPPHFTGRPECMHHCRAEFTFDWHDFGGPIDAPITIACGSVSTGELRDGRIPAFDFEFRAGWCK